MPTFRTALELLDAADADPTRVALRQLEKNFEDASEMMVVFDSCAREIAKKLEKPLREFGEAAHAVIEKMRKAFENVAAFFADDDFFEKILIGFPPSDREHLRKLRHLVLTTSTTTRCRSPP